MNGILIDQAPKDTRRWTDLVSAQFQAGTSEQAVATALQYPDDIAYSTHDTDAGLDFDYSHRQANYREVNLTAKRYQSKSTLIQFGNGKGWGTPKQRQLIKVQHLALPRLGAIEKRAQQLRNEGQD